MMYLVLNMDEKVTLPAICMFLNSEYQQKLLRTIMFWLRPKQDSQIIFHNYLRNTIIGFRNYGQLKLPSLAGIYVQQS